MTELNTIDDIKRELSRVYDETRDGYIEANTGVKLAQILQISVKIIESCDLEKRIETLENTGYLTKEQRDANLKEYEQGIIDDYLKNQNIK